MALIADAGNIIYGIMGTIGFIGIAILVLAVYAWAYIYLLKFKTTVILRERVGDDTSVRYTKAAIVTNKARRRKEIHILKNKLWPLGQSSRWEFPLLGDNYYHHTNKGRKFLEFYKTGELSTDLKPIPPLNPSTLEIKPTNVEIFDWLAQGLVSDANETRQEPDKLARWSAILIPTMFVGALVFGFIYGLDTVKDLQQGNQVIASQLSEWGDRVVTVEEARAGIQRIEAETGDRNQALDIAENAGVPLE